MQNWTKTISQIFKQSKNTLQEFYFDSQNTGRKMDMAATVVQAKKTFWLAILFSAEMQSRTIPNQLNLIGVISLYRSCSAESSNRALKLQAEVAQLDMTTVDYQSNRKKN